MTASASESIISRINKLLALAMDPSASEHERELAKERADRLMVQHQLDRMDLTVEERSKIAEETWEFDTFDYKFRSQMISLADVIIRHCKCRALYGGIGNVRVKIVGFPEDIAYAQQLWSIVFLEMAGKMFPRWDNNKSLDANVYAFVKAGYKWREIHEIAFQNKAEGVPNPYPPEASYRNDLFKDEIWTWDYKQRVQSLEYAPEGGILGRAYKRELKRLGESWSRNTSRHMAYRVSYVSSFTSTISRRLAEMRRKSVENVSDEDRYRLAVIDTEEQVLKEFYRLHPEYDPENIKKANAEWQAREAARRAKMTPEQIAAEERRKQKAYERYRKMRDQQYDAAGWQHGAKVASEVDLNNNKKVKVERDELE